MFRFKRVLALGGFSALLAAVSIAAPAQAFKNTAACTISAEVKVSDKEDPSIGMRLTGGKGSFRHGSFIFACVGVSKGEPDAQVMNIRASGTFVSTICGTGKVVGTIVGLEGPIKYQNILLDKKLAIHFASGVGIFFWHENKVTNLPDLKDDLLAEVTKLGDEGVKPKEDKNWQPAGVLAVGLPLSKFDFPDPSRNHCTKAFTVNGVFTLMED